MWHFLEGSSSIQTQQISRGTATRYQTKHNGADKPEKVLLNHITLPKYNIVPNNPWPSG